MRTQDQRLAPPTQLIDAGYAWAEAEAWTEAAQQAKRSLPELYADGVMLWQAHRNKLQQVIQDGEGIAEFTRANPFSESPNLRNAKNGVVLKNGEHVPASKILWLPSEGIDIPSLDGQTGALPNGGRYKQGRSSIAMSIDAGVPQEGVEYRDIDIDDKRLMLEGVLEDEHVPKGYAVTESVATAVDVGDGVIQRTTVSMHYALARRDIRHLSESQPDIQEDPEEFRGWVLDRLGTNKYDPKIDFSVYATAPYAAGAMRQQVDKINVENTKDEAVVANIERCGQLIGAYAATQFPDLVPHLSSTKS